MLIVYGLIMVASLTFVLLLKRSGEKLNKGLINSHQFKKLLLDIKKINPHDDASILAIKYLKKKLLLFFIVIFAGGFIAFVYEINNIGNRVIDDNNRIMRSDYLKGDKVLSLMVRNSSNGEQEKINVTISEKQYTAQQIDSLVKEAYELLSIQVLSNNESVDHICDDMSFPSSISGYPFSITWRTDDPLLVSTKGIINEERLEKLAKEKDISGGIPIGIHAKLQYKDYSYEYDFYVRIFGRKENTLLSLGEYATELIDEENKRTLTEDYIELPIKIGDVPIEFEEAANGGGVCLIILIFIVAVLLYKREDEDLKNRVTERNNELLKDYPRLLNKFVLFYSAGLTTRGIWSKLCRDYQISLRKGEKKRFLFEEMLITEEKMREGMLEMQAYEEFASRCNIHKYRQFINLLEQSVSKGRNDLLMLLEQEAENAFTERKNRAKELGEEAGTKLLIPLFMMLIVVLIIVLVPAFITFKM